MAATTTPTIAFAQVREDPMVELYVCGLLKSGDIRALCITSGGCTALSMLSLKKFASIDCIDMSISQQWLCELKHAAVIKLGVGSDNTLIQLFLNGGDEYTKDKFAETLDTFLHDNLISNACHDFWMNTWIPAYGGSGGPNTCGTFEAIFRDLVTSNYDYECTFSRTKLIEAFGKSAVEHSQQNEFSDHFRAVMQKYRALYGEDTTQNYFYHQIHSGGHYPSSTEVPPYLLPSAIKSIQTQPINRLNYITQSFVDYIKMLHDFDPYTLIQTSNITDWMDSEEIYELLVGIHRILDVGGFVIMRRLNGDYNLRKIVEQGLANTWEIIPAPIDKSFFYSEVLVLRKRNGG